MAGIFKRCCGELWGLLEVGREVKKENNNGEPTFQKGLLPTTTVLHR